jgi:hypothetical protein
VLRGAFRRARYTAIVVFRFIDKFEKSLVVWEAFQVKKWYPIYMEDFVIEVDLVDPLSIKDAILRPHPGDGVRAFTD